MARSSSASRCATSSSGAGGIGSAEVVVGEQVGLQHEDLAGDVRLDVRSSTPQSSKTRCTWVGPAIKLRRWPFVPRRCPSLSKRLPSSRTRSLQDSTSCRPVVPMNVTWLRSSTTWANPARRTSASASYTCSTVSTSNSPTGTTRTSSRSGTTSRRNGSHECSTGVVVITGTAPRQGTEPSRRRHRSQTTGAGTYHRMLHVPNPADVRRGRSRCREASTFLEAPGERPKPGMPRSHAV